MDVIELSTVVFVSRERAFDFLLDFTNHEQYSEYVADVTRHGDGDVGTQFDITLQWWKLDYTLSPRVVALDRPNRIDWDVPRDVRAEGFWAVEDASEHDHEGQDGCDEDANRDGPVSRVRLRIEFDRDASRFGRLRLPPLVSTDWVLKRVKPIAKREAQTVFERAIADLEGEPRRVDLDLHVRPRTL
ncbi:SRPBCC family protein [Haloarchaeobius sp. DFWS5]|uniref:SRPBCC family protein n=1 Tax=Haloarchaeobius sp. DFWS5 TaxID=3446114 RepID=UPI003EC04633